MTLDRRRLIAGAILAAGLFATGAPAPGVAVANEYTIYSCDADAPTGVPVSSADPFASAFSTSAPLSLQTRGMISDRAGRRCSDGPGLRGLVTSNAYRGGGTVPKGTRGYYVAQAPAGAHFTKVRWAGRRRRRDCRWTVQAYTTGPGGAGTKAIVNRRGGAEDCRGPARGQAAGTGRRPRTASASDAGASSCTR